MIKNRYKSNINSWKTANNKKENYQQMKMKNIYTQWRYFYTQRHKRSINTLKINTI